MPKEKYIVIGKEALRRRLAEAQAQVDSDLVDSAKEMGREFTLQEMLEYGLYVAMIWGKLSADLFGEEEEQ